MEYFLSVNANKLPFIKEKVPLLRLSGHFLKMNHSHTKETEVNEVPEKTHPRPMRSFYDLLKCAIQKTHINQNTYF